MKKKASLLISGITTVAMLAVAVGSFAAWNTLSASANNLKVSTSTPAVLTVVGAEATGETITKLIPSDTTAVATDEGTEIKVGTVTAKLTGKTEKSKITKIETEAGVYDGETKDADYVVTLKKNNTAATITPDSIAGDSGDTYDVYVSFAESVKNDTSSATHQGKTKTVKVTLSASTEAIS